MSAPAHIRNYSSDADLNEMRALIVDSWRILGVHFEWTPGDLAWRRYRYLELDPKNILLYYDAAGTLLAFTWFQPRTGFDLAVHPRHRSRALYAALIDTFERTYPAHVIWAQESSTLFEEVLAEKSYARTESTYLHHVRELDGALSRDLSVPEGFELRAIRGPEEHAVRAAVHRRAFESTRVSDASYLNLMSSVDYDPAFDIVAVDTKTNTFAAFALGWLDAENRTGELEPVGTDPNYRRLGLGQITSAHALDALHRRGAKTGIIYSTGDGHAARSLYGSLGFRVVDHSRGWRRISENP